MFGFVGLAFSRSDFAPKLPRSCDCRASQERNRRRTPATPSPAAGSDFGAESCLRQRRRSQATRASPLTFVDAIERALRQNLAGLLSEYNTIDARGEKWKQLSDLLPNVNGDVQEQSRR